MKALKIFLIVAVATLALVNVKDTPLTNEFNGLNIIADKELYPYIQRYFNMMDENGIEYNRSQPMMIVFNYWVRGTILGIAHGMREDGYVNVHINKQAWAILTVEERIVVMFHELSHDVFNLEHGTIELMGTQKPSNVTLSDVSRMQKELIEYLR